VGAACEEPQNENAVTAQQAAIIEWPRSDVQPDVGARGENADEHAGTSGVAASRSSTAGTERFIAASSVRGIPSHLPAFQPPRRAPETQISQR
jgi:hypothetical protein